MPLPSHSFLAQASASHSRVRLGNDPDWEKYKADICRLYETHKLHEVINMMDEKEKFYSRPNIYKRKLREWNVSKYIKAPVYKKILKEKLRGDEPNAC